jgi:hypothetical protein
MPGHFWLEYEDGWMAVSKVSRCFAPKVGTEGENPGSQFNGRNPEI